MKFVQSITALVLIQAAEAKDTAAKRKLIRGVKTEEAVAKHVVIPAEDDKFWNRQLQASGSARRERKLDPVLAEDDKFWNRQLNASGSARRERKLNPVPTEDDKFWNRALSTSI